MDDENTEPEWTVTGRIEYALEVLNEGDPKGARAILGTLLKDIRCAKDSINEIYEKVRKELRDV